MIDSTNLVKAQVAGADPLIWGIFSGGMPVPDPSESGPYMGHCMGHSLGRYRSVVQ